MDAGLLYELIGYLASILVALLLTMRSILGAAFFTVHGLLISEGEGRTTYRRSVP